MEKDKLLFFFHSGWHYIANDQDPGLQCLLKFKVDLKLRTESLAYENGHLEINEIKTISCIL